jgi:hypothetical protein
LGFVKQPTPCGACNEGCFSAVNGGSLATHRRLGCAPGRDTVTYLVTISKPAHAPQTAVHVLPDFGSTPVVRRFFDRASARRFSSDNTLSDAKRNLRAAFPIRMTALSALGLVKKVLPTSKSQSARPNVRSHHRPSG